MDTKLFKMLHDTINGFATFSDNDVEKQFKRLLVVSDSELNEAGFEESVAIEDAMDELKLAVDDADSIEDDNDDDNDDDEENEDDTEDDDEDAQEDEEDEEEDED